MSYQCDGCARHCVRVHPKQCFGMDAHFCDDCAGYDWVAYDEDADPLLYPPDPREAEYQAREPQPGDTP